MMERQRRGDFETVKVGVKGLFRFNRTPTAIAQAPKYQELLPTIKELYKNCEFWHGTGRYKYGKDKEIHDILEGVIKNDGLIPHEDDWDNKRGPVHTISLAKSRMYARLYAGIFNPYGAPIQNELGSREMWGTYFFGSIGVRFLLENLRSLTRSGVQESRVTYRKKLEDWGAKISTENKGRSFVETFLDGTDIEENYPILMGVKKDTVSQTQGSKYVDVHEGRSEQSIAFANISHLEVPQEKTEEIRKVLDDAGHQEILVIPIEYGEEYCRGFTFKQLSNGKPLEK